METVIYVASQGKITTYALGSNGNVTPLTIISGPASGLSDVSGIAVDARGRVYAVNRGAFGGKPSINIYPAGSNGEVVPVRTIAGPAAELHEPSGIAVGHNGDIYITNGFWSSSSYMPSDGDVAVYAARANGNVPPIGRITGRDYIRTFPHYWIYRPIGLALDRSGTLYVLNPGDEGVAKYLTTSRGKTRPLSRIAGPLTALTRGTAIALDSHGNIFVTDAEANAVTEYARGANGDARPIATISGPATGLSEPSGIVIAGGGDIYVVNSSAGAIFAGASVTEYAPGSNGNATPLATIAGPFTELVSPGAITIGVLPR